MSVLGLKSEFSLGNIETICNKNRIPMLLQPLSLGESWPSIVLFPASISNPTGDLALN
jgi:hypothetical protein